MVLFRIWLNQDRLFIDLVRFSVQPTVKVDGFELLGLDSLCLNSWDSKSALPRELFNPPISTLLS